MKRRGVLALLFGAAAFLPPWRAVRAAEPAAKTHRLTLQVSSNDAGTMTLALNNASKMFEHYKAAGQSAAVEIVVYGPGLHMLRDDTSPVKPRLASLKQAQPDLTFSACANTKRGMEKTEGKEITLVPEAGLVPAGVVRLMELQERGWSYVRP
jgi:intracellular sulfur oxidation DsrE/DsrF family protein